MNTRSNLFHVGFTGTQLGVTDFAVDKLRAILKQLKLHRGFTDFHHGNCVGADEQAHAVAVELGYRTHCHPCDLSHKQANTVNDFTYEVKKALERNRDIVDASELLIAMPVTDVEEMRSGTWATVRYARKIKTEVRIVVDTRKRMNRRTDYTLA